MKQLLFLLVFSFSTLIGTGQTDEDYLRITGKVENKLTSTPLKDVSVKVYKGKELIQTTQTDSTGKYKLKDLAINSTYEVHFVKPHYCYKFAILIVEDKDETLEGGFPLEINTSLFKTRFIRKIRLHFMRKEPVAIAYYSTEEDNMTWNLEYIELMANRIRLKGGL